METPRPSKGRLPFFYGWVIVFISAVFGSFMVGGAQFATGAFKGPMQDTLGWSSSLIFGALTMRWVISGVLQPFFGPWADRERAPRILLPVGAVLMAVSFMALKWVDSAWTYYFWYGVVGAVAMTLANNAFTDPAVFHWFIRKRPKVVMWSNVGPATGPLLFPVVLLWLINRFAWPDAWLWFGVITLIILLPLALLFRTRPVHMGLLPDGDTPEEAAVAATAAGGRPAEISFTLREAMRSPGFWFLTLALTLGMYAVPGYQAHWIPYLQDQGISDGIAASGLFTYGVFTVVARFWWGYLSDRFPLRWTAAVQGLLTSLTVVLFLAVDSTPMLFIWAVATGLNLAGFFQLQALLSVNYFGRAHIGAIRGLMWPLATVTSAFSPMVLGVVRDEFGSYFWGWVSVALAWVFCAVAIAASKPPKRPVRVEQPEAH